MVGLAPKPEISNRQSITCWNHFKISKSMLFPYYHSCIRVRSMH